MALFVDPLKEQSAPRVRAQDSDSDSSSQSGSRDNLADPTPMEGLSICSNSGDSGVKMSDHIYLFLSKIFENETLKDQDFRYLSPDALGYLKDVVRRKFVIGPDLSSIELIKPRRRNEEQFKFVIKKGMKKLFKSFKKSHKNFIKGDKILDELEFYKHYFWETSVAERIQFDAFFLPASKLQREFASPGLKADKTVTLAYISRLFRSELFRRDFVAYLLNGFVEEYVQHRAQKLMKVAVNFEAGKRPKSNKLPWTRWEMVEAQKSLVNVIYSMGN
jgi:hypothetical protein